MVIFGRYFTRVSYFGLLAILPIALWVLLWLGVGGAATNVYQFDNKILFFHGLRALFPYIALGVGVLITLTKILNKEFHRELLWGPLGFVCAYGLIGMFASFRSNSPLVALQWAILYLSVPMVLLVSTWRPNSVVAVIGIIKLNIMLILFVSISILLFTFIFMDIGSLFLDLPRLLRCETPGNWFVHTNGLIRSTGVGRFAAIAALISLTLVSKESFKPLWLIIFAVSVALLLSTGARTSIICLSVCLVGFVVLTMSLKRALIVISGLGIIGCLLLTTGLPQTFLKACIFRSYDASSVSYLHNYAAAGSYFEQFDDSKKPYTAPENSSQATLEVIIVAEQSALNLKRMFGPKETEMYKSIELDDRYKSNLEIKGLWELKYLGQVADSIQNNSSDVVLLSPGTWQAQMEHGCNLHQRLLGKECDPPRAFVVPSGNWGLDRIGPSENSVLTRSSDGSVLQDRITTRTYSYTDSQGNPATIELVYTDADMRKIGELVTYSNAEMTKSGDANLGISVNGDSAGAKPHNIDSEGQVENDKGKSYREYSDPPSDLKQISPGSGKAFSDLVPTKALERQNSDVSPIPIQSGNDSQKSIKDAGLDSNVGGPVSLVEPPVDLNPNNGSSIYKDLDRFISLPKGFLRLSGRTDIWEAGWSLIKLSPWIGYGFHGDRMVLGAHIHNSILASLIQTGFVGTLMFVGGIAFAWLFAIKTICNLNNIKGSHRNYAVQACLFLLFFSARGLVESSGAFFGIDTLVLLPYVVYLQVINSRDNTEQVYR